MEEIKKYLPVLVFVFTALLGLASVFLSYRMQKLKGRVPEIFQVQYPTEPPATEPPVECDSACMTPTGCDWDCDWYKDRCREDPDSDPWCCADDDETPPPIPSPGHYECVDLGPQPSSPQQGEVLNFECRGLPSGVTINHYNFRVQNVGGSVLAQERVDTTSWSANFNFTVPGSGAPFLVQCQVCISSDNSDCTDWGQEE